MKLQPRQGWRALALCATQKKILPGALPGKTFFRLDPVGVLWHAARRAPYSPVPPQRQVQSVGDTLSKNVGQDPAHQKMHPIRKGQRPGAPRRGFSRAGPRACPPSHNLVAAARSLVNVPYYVPLWNYLGMSGFFLTSAQASCILKSDSRTMSVRLFFRWFRSHQKAKTEGAARNALL